MLTVYWHKGLSSGYRDLLPDIEQMSDYQSFLVHPVVGPKGGASLAKCEVRVRKGAIDLDYSSYAEFNTAQSMYLGVLRIALKKGKADHALWRDEGDKGFVAGETQLITSAGVDFTSAFAASAYAKNKSTTSKQETQARIGQVKFRKSVEARWNGHCALTKISVPAVLRSSHIKPWAISSNKERLDPENGLLLAAHVDALFDRYLISFDQSGQVLWHTSVSAAERKILNLPRALTRPLSAREIKYLKHHTATMTSK